MNTSQLLEASGHKKIWIDLDNSPHVPFFAPIIDELDRRGYSLIVTARDAYQVRELADLFQLTYKLVGRHYGKHRILKVLGTCFRSLQLLPIVLNEKPDLALGHGSRSMTILSGLLGIPSICIFDYEFANQLPFLRPTWLMVPEVIPDSAFPHEQDRLLRYPGIKEDVYVPDFKPDRSLASQLGLDKDKVIVTLRPPATEAHYHNPQSDELFKAAVEFLSQSPCVKVILLPRNTKQGAILRQYWPDLFAAGKIVIPENAVDGLNLIWHSDLVISGGGTMNREAAAMGVPVYSIFRGKIGAVDTYLAKQGRLVLIESVEDVRTRIILSRRPRTVAPQNGKRTTLTTIVDSAVSILESQEQYAMSK